MKKEYWIYGILTGILLIAVQAIEYKVMVRETRMEIFVSFIALLFLTLGLWAGPKLREQRPSWLAKSIKGRESGLSDRELEVLNLLATGLSNQEIAEQLFISLNTTKTHLGSIYQKLSVVRRTQAVQKALELGLLESPKRVKS